MNTIITTRTATRSNSIICDTIIIYTALKPNTNIITCSICCNYIIRNKLARPLKGTAHEGTAHEARVTDLLAKAKAE